VTPCYHYGVTRTAAARIEYETDVPASFAAARDICRRQAKGFCFALSFLPRPKRNAACAVYAFCRMIDEALVAGPKDSDGSAERMRHRPLEAGASCCSTDGLEGRLLLLRDRLDEIYRGALELPAPGSRSEAQHALRAFEMTVSAYEIPKQYFLDFAHGRRTDLEVTRYATWPSLERYCYHTGGAGALILACLTGVTHSGAAEYAIKMGAAMRLTSILRDVGEDFARHGRIYLPLEDMARFRYSERDLAAGVVNENFRGLMRFEIARARRLYAEGAEGLCWLAGDGSRLTAATMAVVHAGILDAIERQRYDVFSRRAKLSASQKLRRMPLAWRLARRESGDRLPDVFAAR
jgi:phytoene synthase